MKSALRFLLTAALAAAAWAQTTPPAPFSMRIVQGSNVQVVTDGATIALPADGIGLAASASITVNYTGLSQAVIGSAALTGSTDFSIVNAPPSPPTLTPASPSTAYAVQYLPTISKAQSAKLIFQYTEGTTTTAKGTFTLSITGTAPEFGYTYTVQPNGNTTLLNSGDSIAVPPSPVLTPETTTIAITNRGSGAGVVNAITYKGTPDIALAGLPFPPTSVAAGATLQFQVIFTPSDLPAVSGMVQVSFVAGRTLMFTVTGSGLGAEYSYQVVRGGPAKNSLVLPGGTIALPDTNVNQTSTLVLQVNNVGNDYGQINTISASGTGYSLSAVPFLPLQVAPGASFTFTINFAPTAPGKAVGKLAVGSDSFDLSSNGLGSILAYSYVASSSTFQLQSGGSVVFAPVAVGQTNSVHFIVANTGTAATSVNSVSATGPSAATFVLANLPALPATVAPNAAIGFDVVFAPAALSTVTGTLRIDSQTFTLTGVGNTPAPIPAYSITGAGGTVDPRSQPAVGLSLAATYPMDLTGTLNLTFNSAVFANDPSVQFQVGGRSVPFTIPANTKQALFPNQATQIQAQAGTVAGTIVLVPTFATALGGIDLTPINPPSLALTIAQQAPALLSVVMASKTSNTITLNITGYATSRSMGQVGFQFTPISTENVATTQITMPADASFSAWYQSPASTAFGSNFTASVTLTLAGTVNKADSLADTIQSIAVTLTNSQGTSKTVTVAVQ